MSDATRYSASEKLEILQLVWESNLLVRCGVRDANVVFFVCSIDALVIHKQPPRSNGDGSPITTSYAVKALEARQVYDGVAMSAASNSR